MTDKKAAPVEDKVAVEKQPELKQKEIGGPKGKEPTQWGDWVVGGRVSDF